MEVLNIQKYLKNFNIVISDDVYTNIDLREDMDYYPQVSEYIQKHWRKYKDSYFITILIIIFILFFISRWELKNAMP